MERVRIKARGKINLSLNILGTRGNMHVLESVMSSVDIYDTVDVEFDFSGKCEAVFQPSPYACGIPADNSVYKAVEFLRGYYPGLGARVSVKKVIPIAGGLGGSSADAAAVIYAAKLLLPYIDGIERESVKTGSDVPAMLRGGCLLVSSTGELCKSLKIERLHVVIARGAGGVSTAEAYRTFDEMFPSHRFCPSDTEALAEALARGDTRSVASYTGNALSAPAIKLCPEINATLAALRDKGAQAAFMTGSGSCCCGLFDTEAKAKTAAAELARDGMYAVYAPTASKGMTHTFLR